MFLGASRTIALAGLVIALAREFIATADAIAVASDGRGFDGHQSHSAFLRTGDTTRAAIVSQVGDHLRLLEAKMRGSICGCGFKLCEAEGVANLFVQRDPDTIGVRKKYFHHARIKLPAGISLDFFSRSGNGQRFAIWAIRYHRIERIGHGEYSRAERNLLAPQPAGIAGPVVALLVRQHDLCSFLEKRNSLQHRIADIAMAAHDFAFFR